MISWTAFVAPIALLFPVVHAAPGDDARALSGPEEQAVTEQSAQERWTAFQPWRGEQPPMQVRIEQRVTIRVAPARPRSNLVADLPRNFPDRLVERKMGDCIAAKDVVGVQTGGTTKLILFMRDRGMISAQLEKACSARDFYSGFYVEPSKDGKLCIKRDELLSRNGTKCELSRFSRLELVRN
ncbi:hypothetical protein [Parerythrobacter aestuarii]|uniref:hypothetical protein n=1 Tax=Parerythrobacter aestuarii TaxID=3020909 RepID=UPI0024DE9080|nr:hypothetical protein [Parerythrobacter aestuarii]